MLEAYVENLARCTTGNQFNRLHITMENVLAPAEVCGLIDAARERWDALPEPSTHWLARMDTLLRGNGRPVQPYRRHVLAEGATVYAARADDRERAARTLVFAYSGDSFRLMMPVALFLQHCPADRYEFVVMIDRARTFYLSGIAGLGNNLPDSIVRLGERCVPASYRRAISFGTSAGGLAAIWTGVALGLERAVSVGGSTPIDVADRYNTQGISTTAFDDALNRATRLPEVLLVTGERNERDINKALAMTSRLTATTITIPDSTHHNVLWDVWNRGGLDELLERLLEKGEASG